MYTHLHWHSHYSLLEWMGKPSEIVKKAKKLNMTSIAITDYGSMYGAVEFYKYAKGEGIKAIVWVELSLTENISSKEKNEGYCWINFLCKDETGYQNLLELVSNANLDAFNNFARIDMQLVRKYAPWLICFVWWAQSILWHMILNKDAYDMIKNKASTLIDVFWEDFYFELIIREHLTKDEKLVNETIFKLAQELGVKVFISNNFHYVSKEDKEAFEVLSCIKEWRNIFDQWRKIVNSDLSIIDEETITKNAATLGYSQEQIAWFLQICEEIDGKANVSIKLGQLLFPNYESPKEIQTLYATNKANLEE